MSYELVLCTVLALWYQHLVTAKNTTFMSEERKQQRDMFIIVSIENTQIFSVRMPAVGVEKSKYRK